jgi:hypothetical protein
MKLNRFTWSNLMFMNFQLSPKKLSTFFLLVSFLFAITGCKPSIDHLVVVMIDNGETYHFENNKDEGQSIEIKPGDEITIEVKTTDSKPEHIKYHIFSWQITGQNSSEWIFNRIEERDTPLQLEGNKIILKAPQDISSEITLEITVTCPENPELPTSLRFKVKSISQQSLEQIYNDTQDKAFQIDRIIELEMPEASNKKEATRWLKLQVLRQVIADYFYKQETEIEYVKEKNKQAEKLLAKFEDKPNLASDLIKYFHNQEIDQCVKAAVSLHWRDDTDQVDSSLAHKFCMNNVNDYSHRKARRKLSEADYMQPFSMAMLGLAARLIASECWSSEALLIMFPEPSTKAVAAAELPLCTALSVSATSATALYYLNQFKSEGNLVYPYIYKQKYVTHIFYNPILSYKILNNDAQLEKRGILQKILKG